MLKLIFFFVIGLTFGFGFIANIVVATNLGFSTVKHYLEFANDFYKLVAQLFIIATHSIFQLYMTFGINIMGIIKDYFYCLGC
ncbi:Spiroplasmavirus-related protein [Spiroplasma kunkelii CR2-3x]|uniref:Spiroplasmavirus-related protein n=1 Tax=Spiroplasma kunkelii CR2-3x TaxID=273035 RepID=A0A0K2JHE2_SPIKU|nr:hypothetical protein [Spiroplasma kunkelii]ALA97656.1 Spiroplasmavirus-related protein [Spiroplasma kunkelii CR2-3x]